MDLHFLKLIYPELKVEFSLNELEDKLRNGNIVDVVTVLMDGERFTMEVYEYLSRNATEELVGLFEQLSEIERMHYERLRKLLDELKKNSFGP